MTKKKHSNSSGIFAGFMIPLLTIFLFSFSDKNNETIILAQKLVNDTNPDLAFRQSREIKNPLTEDSAGMNDLVYPLHSSRATINKEASYPGGSRAWLYFLGSELRYPEKLQRLKIEGKVIVHFTIDEKGRVGNIEALSGEPILQKEAKRVIRNSGKWLPAQQNGQPIVSEKEQAITFRIESPREETKVGKNIVTDSDSSATAFTFIDLEASYPGGPHGWMRYLNSTFRYPLEAQNNNIEGTVVVQFIVDTDGRVSNVEAISGPMAGGLREESVRVIKHSGKWLPAIKDGIEVKSVKRLPISYRLELR